MEVDGEEINGKFCFFGASIHTVILHSPEAIHLFGAEWTENPFKIACENEVASIVSFLSLVRWLAIHELCFHLLLVKCY